MKLHKTKYKVLFFFATLLLAPYAQAAEGFMYGKAESSSGGVWIKLKLELCSPPPSPITAVFDDGSIGEVEIDKKWIAIMDKRGQTKQDAKETKHIYGEFVPKYCSVKYVSKEQTSKKAILAVLNSSKIKTKKITDWKIVKYKDLDKNILLKAKPLDHLNVKKRVGIKEANEFCHVSWTLKDEDLLLGYKEKMMSAEEKKKTGMYYGAPVFDYENQCQAKMFENILYVTCKYQRYESDEAELGLTYVGNKCVGFSAHEPRDIGERATPGIFGEIDIDGDSFYILGELSEGKSATYLIRKNDTDIDQRYFSPSPIREIP